MKAFLSWQFPPNLIVNAVQDKSDTDPVVELMCTVPDGLHYKAPPERSTPPEKVTQRKCVDQRG
jgi:hypothetical protein